MAESKTEKQKVQEITEKLEQGIKEPEVLQRSIFMTMIL